MIESDNCSNASSGAPITTFEPASSTIAASSRPGSFADTGCGMAPTFQHGEVGDEPVDRVGHGDGDEVAQPDAVRRQFAGQPVARAVRARHG